MTRKKLQNNVKIVCLIYVSLVLLGLYLYFYDPCNSKDYYIVYKDLIVPLVAIPAAYLGYCFQRRSVFNEALRQLWANVIESVNEARQYTFENNPSQALYGRTIKSMWKVIDEVRGVYRNIGETYTKNDFEKGIYPYESLKRIKDIVSKLGYGDNYDLKNSESARKRIDCHFFYFKSSFLHEFDRPLPTIWDTPYAEKKLGHYNHWTEKCDKII